MASMTITIDDSQVDRVLNAVWANHHDGEMPPSRPEAVKHLREWLYLLVKREVRGYEAAAAARAITERADDPLDLTVQ